MHYAVISGLSASLASLFGKLSGETIFEDSWLLRAVFLILMIVCNAIVWTFFVKALQESQSTLSTTVLSTATNYIFSALFGIVLFQEVTTLLWWTGMSLIICGIVCIVRDEESDLPNKIK